MITTAPVHSEPLQGQKAFGTKTIIFGFIGFGAAALWTVVGFAIAFAQKDHWHFIAEWQRMQAFPCLGLGVWLLLISKSGELTDRARRVTKDGFAPPQGIISQRIRVAIILVVTCTGIISFIAMGFNASGALLTFMWIMCVFICSIAGIVTLHGIDLLVVIHNLQHAELKTFRYSPARTPELREIVNYFSFFTLLLTIAYGFACLGTFRGQWTGDRTFVAAAQLFWPAVYVPACTVALIYPHIVIHKVIQRAKDSALSFYQRDIDGLLSNYQGLNNDEVQRVNALAQLFDRINATPNYVFDLGIAARTGLPHLVNLAVFFAKPLIGHG